MAGKIKFNIMSFLLLLSLLGIGGAQTFAEVSQNFCAGNPDQPDDNLSCPSVSTGGVACLPRTALCNGMHDCKDGADEGDLGLLAGLNCKYNYT